MAFWDEVEPAASGDWGPGQSYDQPVTDSTVTSDVATTQASVDNSGLNSPWTGFGSLLDKVVSYGLSRDAAKTNLQLQQQRQQVLGVQPLVSKTASGVSINPTGLVLIGAIVLAVAFVANHKG